jgi:hypothetical protein
MKNMEQFEKDGLLGEKKFRDYLDRLGVPYLPIDQAPETHAQQFHGTAKRPDSLVLLGAARLAAIDVKYKKPAFWIGSETVCVGVNRVDLERLAEFERISGIRVFLAFFDGWNPGFADVWRIVKLAAIKPAREFDDFVVIDINSLPLVRSRAQLMPLLMREVAR